MQTLGVIKVFFGGTELNIKPGGTLKLGGIVSKSVVAGTQVHYANVMMESEVAVKMLLLRGQRLLDLLPAGVAQELQVQCDTGQTFVFVNGFRKETLDVTSGDQSEVGVTFGAGTPLEI